MNYLDAVWQIFLLVVLVAVIWNIVRFFKKRKN